MSNTIKHFATVVLLGGVILLGFFGRLYYTNYKLTPGRPYSGTLPSANGVVDRAVDNKVSDRTLDNHEKRINSLTPSLVNSIVSKKSSSSANSKSYTSNSLPYQYKGTVLSSNQHYTELVSAFFDFREGRRMIAVIGCKDHRVSQVHYYCLVKYSNGLEKCISKETSNEMLSGSDENTRKNCWSHRFACNIDSGDDLPTAVALSTSPTCESPKSAWLDILNTKYEGYVTGSPEIKKVTFGVCFQTPFYNAKSWKKEVLIEAIERYISLGAEWFTVYFRTNPSSEIMQVLSQYKIIEAINMTVSDATYYELRYYGELLAIRDCVYRNMYRVKYLALTDIDEVIVPQSESLKNIPDMLSSIDTSVVGAFQFKHVAFMVDPGSEQPSTEYTCPAGHQILRPRFLTHTYRTKPFPVPETVGLGRWKVIVKPLRVDKIGIHSVYGCMSGQRQISVPEGIGLLYHYRKDPFFDPARCGSCRTDKRLTELAPGLADTYFTKTCRL